jgi:hypothetical protein
MNTTPRDNQAESRDQASRADRLGLVASLFDLLSEPLFVVDADMRVEVANRATRELTGRPGQEVELVLRQGEAMGCLNAAAGCGRSPGCSTCELRGLVREALTSGELRRAKVRITRRTTEAERTVEAPLHFLVSAFPLEHHGRRLCLLALADIQTLLDIRGLMPICAGCKKIRDEGGRWESVERHLGERLDVDFSHSLCPDCVTRLYG